MGAGPGEPEGDRPRAAVEIEHTDLGPAPRYPDRLDDQRVDTRGLGTVGLDKGAKGRVMDRVAERIPTVRGATESRHSKPPEHDRRCQ